MGIVIAIGVAYFIAARFGLAFRSKPGGVAVFWPAAGIAIGALIALGPNARLLVAIAVTAATVVSKLLITGNLWLGVTFGVVCAGQTLLTAWLTERWFGGAFKLENVNEVLGFVVASTAGAVVAAFGAVAAISFAHSTTSAMDVWRPWFAACLLGTVTVAPLLIGLAAAVRELPPRRELIEGAAALVALAALSVFLISLPKGHWATALPVALVFPVLLWVAVRCRPVFAAAAAFIVGLAIIWSTTFNLGHFGDESIALADRILTAQTFVLVGALLTIILAALFADRRRNESILRVSNERLELAISGAKLGAFSLDLDTGCLECDARAAQIHGHKEPPKTIKEGRRFVHPHDRARIDAAFAEAQRSGGVWNAEYRVLQPPHHPHAGEVRWVAFDGSIVRSDKDAPLRLLGVTRDITEHKRAEAQLAEREAQLALFVEHAPAAIAMFDREMRYLAVSRRFVSDFRISPDTQLIGRSHYEIFPDIPQRWRDVHTRVLAGEELSQEEDQFKRQDGRIDWMRWSMAPWRGANGSIGGAILFSEVRTEQVEARRALADSEAGFRATFENAAVGVALVGPDGSILRVNNSFSHMLGYSVEELQTKTFQDVTYRDDIEANVSILKKAFIGKAYSHAIEKRYVRKNGGIVWGKLTVSCVRKADGTVDYVVAVIEDVTRRKRSEQTLAERDAQLVLAQKAARVGCYTYDAIAGTMRFSRASAETYSLSQNTIELTAQKWLARVHRDDVQRMRAEHISAFKNRQHDLVEEFRIVLEGGEVRWIEARSLISYDHAGRAERMTGVYIDVTERRKAEDQKSLLIAELDHRVKNVLACVAAVAQRTRECSRSPDEFLDELNGRINSLASTHALLSRGHWQGVGLGELVRGELAFCTKDDSAVVEGPEVNLAAEAAQPVAMVLHELATNAAKYGALSNRHGRIAIRWRRQSNGGAGRKLVLDWQETGGPPVGANNVSGYGTSVIRDLIPFELGGAVDYELAPEGARCRLEIPAKWLSNPTRAHDALAGVDGQARAVF